MRSIAPACGWSPSRRALDINLTLKLFRTIACLACFASFPLALVISSAMQINVTTLVLLRGELNCSVLGLVSFPPELDFILLLFSDEINCSGLGMVPFFPTEARLYTHWYFWAMRFIFPDCGWSPSRRRAGGLFDSDTQLRTITLLVRFVFPSH